MPRTSADSTKKGQAATEEISIVVVVSGQPIQVKVNLHQRVEQLVHLALQQSGNKGQQSSEWELRTSDGTLLDQAREVSVAGITDGMTLYLSPKAGAGGAAH